MNTDMMGGVIRAVFAPVVAYMIGRGVLPAGDYGAVATAVVSLVTALWSVHSNKTGKVIK